MENARARQPFISQRPERRPRGVILLATPRIVAARQQQLLEGAIGKRREHSLPACARIRELHLLLRKIQPLDRQRLPDPNGVPDDGLDRRTRLNRRTTTQAALVAAFPSRSPTL
jgi:hypothetical protein